MKLKASTSNFLNKTYWWLKATLLVIFISSLAYGFGTFTPNPIAVKKATEEVRIEHAIWAEKLGLNEPSFEYTNSKEFIIELNKCVDFLNYHTPPDKRVPIQMVTAQAALESAWGQSRFAVKANNLFGIRVFKSTKPHLLPQGVEKWPGWGVRIFETKCNSVKEYIRLLNEHPAYKEFRELRAKLLKDGELLDAKALVRTLDKFSTTEDYDERVINIMSKVEKVLDDVKEEDITKVILPEDKP
jgi:Bax protein